MHSSRCFRTLVALTALLLASPNSALAAPPAPTMQDALAAIRAYAPRALAEQGAPGMSVAITDRTQTIAVLTLGYANVDAKTPVTETTRFPVGSITKSMTALALLQDVDRGRVALDAPVTRYLPWFAIRGASAPVLVHQLLSHTAGTPDDYAGVAYGFDVAALREAHVLFTPGTAWSYSNDGYATVGALVKQIEGRPWEDAVANEVLAPIGMQGTSPDFTPENMEDAAVGYTVRDTDRATPPNPALMPTQRFDFEDPAGSVISNPQDMARYMRFFLNGGVTANGRRLVSQKTFEAMTTPDRFSDGKPAGSAGVEMAEWPDFYRQYGYGLSIFDTGGDRLIGHTGGISGYTACMQMNLTRGFGVVAMSNLVEAPLHPCAIVRYAMAVLRAQSLGDALPAAPGPPPDPAVVEHAADYAGSYRNSDGRRVEVKTEGARLTLVDGGLAYPLLSRGEDSFWTGDPAMTVYELQFERDASKKVAGFTNGSTFFAGSSYRGPMHWTYPARWDAYVGRYENTFFGDATVTRVIVVKNQLTLDGDTPLEPKPDGSFGLGVSRIRFDTITGGKAQRLWLDGVDLYRVDLK